MEDKDLLQEEGCACGGNCGCNDTVDELDDEEGCGCGDGCGCGSDEDGEGCGCGHDHHHSIYVTLEDENGREIQCEVVEGFVFEDNEYALVQNPEDGSNYLFKVVGEGEEGQLVVPDDEEFNKAIAYYETLLGSDQ